MKFLQNILGVAALIAPLTATSSVAIPEGSVLIMNEETTGNPNNGSINIFNPAGEGSWVYRAFRQNNPGRELPGAICHARQYGDRLYVVSNHPVAPGSYEMTGTLTVLDAETLGFITSVELTNAEGRGVQGRAVMPGTPSGAMVTTTDGIVTFDESDKTVKYEFPLEFSPDGNPSTIPYQYPYQTGMIARSGHTLAIASQSYGLLLLDESAPAETRVLSVKDMFPTGIPQPLTADCGIGSVVTDNAGCFWMSVTADMNASGTAAGALICCDLREEEPFRVVQIPDGIYPPANSWYAWTPDGFHASATSSKLYWNGGPNTWFSNQAVFSYDIDTDSFTKILDLTAEELAAGETPWQIYGCSMRTSPLTGDMYLSLFKDYGLTTFTLRRLDESGVKIADYPMQPDIWYPSLPVFADTASPEMNTFEKMTLPTDAVTEIDLTGMAKDADSPNSEIAYNVIAASHGYETGFESVVKGNALIITPYGTKNNAPVWMGAPDGYSYPEDCWVDVEADSQGKKAVSRLKFGFASAGVTEVSSGHTPVSAEVKRNELTLWLTNPTTATIYNTSGRVVMSINAPAGESVHTLDGLPDGVYILRIAGGNFTLKFVYISGSAQA